MWPSRTPSSTMQQTPPQDDTAHVGKVTREGNKQLLVLSRHVFGFFLMAATLQSS